MATDRLVTESQPGPGVQDQPKRWPWTVNAPPGHPIHNGIPGTAPLSQEQLEASKRRVLADPVKLEDKTKQGKH